MISKTILITGSTDGLGLAAAQQLAASGHNILLHGRSQQKLDDAAQAVRAVGGTGIVEQYRADLSELAQVEELAAEVASKHPALDVLINNAGVFKTSVTRADNGLDIRFMVNVIAPYVLTRQLLPSLGADSRVVNLSSAAQAPVDPRALAGSVSLDDGTAYAQSKLAITMWSAHLARELGAAGPMVVSVNPASFLGTNMVKDAYEMDGNDISIGADILARAALSDEFADASGRYYDNDARRFADPHPDALDPEKNAVLVELIGQTIATLGFAGESA